jgi:hydrogenase maturation protease
MRMEEAKKPVLVLGVGNILLQDEGVGVHVVNELLKLELPDHVEVIDGGTAGFDLVAIVDGREKVIVVDAVMSAEDPPGTIYRMSPENLQPTFRGKTSIHQFEFLDVLGMTHLTGTVPETVIFGVVPREFEEFGMELTPEIRALVPRLVELVLRELGVSGQAG